MARTVRVLILEDNPNDAELVVHELSRADFDPEWTIVDNKKDFLAQLETPPDIILSDFSLPQFDALQALRVLKERDLDIPLIVVSGTIGEEVAVSTIQGGASDYLLKDRLSRLGAAITGALSKQALKQQHQQAVDEMRRREELYRSLVQSARDAIITISIDGTVTSLNPAFRTITGWETGEWIGNTFFDLLHPDEMQIAFEFFQQVFAGHEAPIHEFRIRTASGPYISGEITASPQIMNGKVAGILGIIRDTSERRMFDEQMREAQKMESLGTLAGGIAHDFNNILGIVLGYVELLEKVEVPENANYGRYLETIKKAIDRGRTVVQQVLTFARKEEVVQRPVQINDVVHEVSKMLGETFPKLIELEVSADPSLPRVSVDGSQLHQALLNLCVNARDAILDADKDGRTGGKITMATGVVKGAELRRQFTEAVAELYISLSVADTGSGMDEETRKRIFDPFFTTKGKGKGTGLGLAVVYGIVQTHGGFVDVDSRLHGGTRFTLYIPVSTRNGGAAEAGPAPAEGSLRGSETILLIEDEEPLLYLMKVFLENNGYTVLAALDGKTGVELYLKHRQNIALVLSDVGLPVLGGIAVVQKIRELDGDVPVLLASGYLTPHQQSEIKSMGIEHVIPKPYEPQGVLATIRETLNAPLPARAE